MEFRVQNDMEIYTNLSHVSNLQLKKQASFKKRHSELFEGVVVDVIVW